MHHSSGCQHKRCKVFFLNGPWQCKRIHLRSYTFEIVYHKGTENINADSISRNPIPISHSVAATSSQLITANTQSPQLNDPVIKQIHNALSISSINLQMANGHSLSSGGTYRFGINCLTDGVVCHTYKPGPSQQLVTVPAPLLSASLHKSAIYQSHDIPALGHQGISKTLQRLQEVAYWVGMAQDVSQYCAHASVLYVSKQNYLHLHQPH